MQLPGPLREAIEQELSDRDGARLRAAAAQLSERYRQMEGGPHLSSSGKCGAGEIAMSEDVDRAAYLAVRMPATFAAITAALQWTREALGEEESAQMRSMLDLGSGPGTALWAAAQVFPMLASATAVERDPRLIEIGRRLVHSDDRPQQVNSGLAGDPIAQPQQANSGLAGDPIAAVREAQWLCGDLTSDLPPGSWDLVVCAYALNEVGERDRSRLIRQAWARCSKLLVVVEPGTKAGFANVLAVRSQMLDPNKPNAGLLGTPESDLEVQVPRLVAPCPHSLACPMAAAGDWCHFAARVERTSFHRRLKQAELGHEDEKFSYVAFARGLPRRKAERPPARIVRHPRVFSGYAQLTLCTEGKLEQKTVTRSQKEDWRRLKRLGWGDER